MRFFKSLTYVLFITAMAVFYVHQQVELVKLSYSIDYKEKRLKDMLDRNEYLGYNIDNLEAPSRLEQVLVARKMDIAFPKKDHVYRMAKSGPSAKDMGRQGKIVSEKHGNILNVLEFFSPRAEAQVRK